VTHEQAFLADIIAHPADDAPRLILADWLDERGGEGDAERAEFIRVQCALARLPPARDACECWESAYEPTSACPRCLREEALHARERELLARLCVRLPGETPFGTRCVMTLDSRVRPDESSLPVLTLRRGFVGAAALAVTDYLDHTEALQAAQPVREVRLTLGAWAGEGLLVNLLCERMVGRLHTLDLSRLAVRPRDWWRAIRQVRLPWRGLRRLLLPAGWAGRPDGGELASRTSAQLPGIEVALGEG
jgi:uncharacterized protein (TIGR02996 family)